jgi:hypothetical protein
MDTLRAIVVECRSLLENDESVDAKGDASDYAAQARLAQKASARAGQASSDYPGAMTQRRRWAMTRVHEKAGRAHYLASTLTKDPERKADHNSVINHHEREVDYHLGHLPAPKRRR